MKDFSKFKKKVIMEHVIKSLILGISISMSLTAIFIVVAKIVPLNIHFMLFVLFGILVALGFSYLFYKVLMPSDIQIAKRLDKNLDLNEKVQTMIQYKDQNGILVEIQRESTLEKLNAIPTKKLPMKIKIINYVLAVFALGLFTTSLIVPSKVVAEPDVVEPTPDDNSTSTDEQNPPDQPNNPGDSSSGFDEAHDAIEGSDVDQDIKDKMDKVVDDLEKELEDDTLTDEERDEKIEDAKDKIDKIVDDANSKEEIGDSLKKSEDETLQELGEAIKNGDNEGVEDALEKLKEELGKLTGDELIEALDKISQEIKDALEDSGIEEGDKLRDALDDLADSLKETSDQLKNETIDDDTAHDQINDAIDKAIKDIQDALDEQKKVEDLGEDVKDALDKEKSENKQDGENQDGDPNGEGDKTDQEGEENGDTNDKEGDDNKDQPGGEGDGNTVFGSDDSVFTGDGYHEYGDVIDDYYDGVLDRTKDENTPSDIEDILRDYFESLYNGNK